MANFPTISKPEDSKYFTETQMDPAMVAEFEGGYEFRRPRYTRAPRKLLTTGFTQITDADKDILQSSYDAQQGASGAMDYTHPVNANVMSVYYSAPMMFTYVGIGGYHKWDVKIQLKEI